MSDARLTGDQLSVLGEQMRRELDALASEIATLESITAPVAPDPAIGRLSRLEAMSEKGVNEAALRSARARSAGLRVALGRIADEDFGLCARCDDAIPFARLQSMPGTRLCVRCAQRAEA